MKTKELCGYTEKAKEVYDDGTQFVKKYIEKIKKIHDYVLEQVEYSDRENMLIHTSNLLFKNKLVSYYKIKYYSNNNTDKKMI